MFKCLLLVVFLFAIYIVVFIIHIKFCSIRLNDYFVYINRGLCFYNNIIFQSVKKSTKIKLKKNSDFERRKILIKISQDLIKKLPEDKPLKVFTHKKALLYKIKINPNIIILNNILFYLKFKISKGYNYKKEYKRLMKKYRGTMSLKEKQIKYQLITLEIEDKIRDIAKFDRDKGIKETTQAASLFSGLMSFVLLMNTIYNNQKNSIKMLCALVLILMFLFSVYMLLRTNITGPIVGKIEIERRIIIKLRIKKLVIKNLILEEDDVKI